MKAMTIDLERSPRPRFHIDSFFVADGARSAFEQTMTRNVQRIEALPGCGGHLYFEKVAGPTTLNIVSLSAWESQDAFDGASNTIRDHYREIGIDAASLPAQFTPFALASMLSSGGAETPLRTIDLDRDHEPSRELHFGIDSFFVPESARGAFEETMARSLAFAEKQPGYRGRLVFERPGGPTTLHVVSMVTWESQEAFEHVSEVLNAHVREIGFDIATLVSRSGIRAEIGNYRRL